MLCIDGHLDLAMNALIFGRDLKKSVAEVREWERWMQGKARGVNTVCFPDMRRGEVFLCFSTIIGRHASGLKSHIDYSPEGVWAMGQAQLAYYRILERQGVLRQLTTAAQVEAHVREWEGAPDTAPLGHVLCVEGADPLLSPDEIFRWWEEGLRILSLVHYGIGYYAHGTNTVGGLFPPGRELLKNMEQVGMILDLTHTADGSFWEALDLFGGRVIATHNNCRALVPRQRQFDDDQIRAIIARDGVIGAAFDNWMLHPDHDQITPHPEWVTISHVVDHIDHICQLAGNARHVAIGTDLDGGYGKEQSPNDLDTIADLQKIPDLLRGRGYSEADIVAIMRGNWLRLLAEALPKG